MTASLASQGGWSLLDAHQWTDLGTRLFGQQISALSESSAQEPSALPGWTRKELVAHLCGNAEALGRLVHWASTGDPTLMYASTDQRRADIEAGGKLSIRELLAWFGRSAADLATGMDALTPDQWATEVVTAQGRAVPATIIPWLRAREVLIHAVDLDTGLPFDDLPRGFLTALVTDIATKRNSGGSDSTAPTLVVTSSGHGDSAVVIEIVEGEESTTVRGNLSDIASYLAGRTTTGGLRVSPGQQLPQLSAWL